jgi:Putative heavy-metal-binding
MERSRRGFWLCLITFVVMSCATTQSRYSWLGESYPPKPEGYQFEVFQTELPSKAFVRISRVDVHLEKTHFISSSLEDALPELKRQARLSGADAIIEIRESTSAVGETKIYHVTAIGIRYTDTK